MINAAAHRSCRLLRWDPPATLERTGRSGPSPRIGPEQVCEVVQRASSQPSTMSLGSPSWVDIEKMRSWCE